jgi:hypothetical protein
VNNNWGWGVFGRFGADDRKAPTSLICPMLTMNSAFWPSVKGGEKAML